MIREHQVRGFADEQVAFALHAELAQPIDFRDQADGVDDHAVADDAQLAFAQNAGGHKVQDVFLFADEDRMTGVVAALCADHDIGPLGQHVDDFAFAFIAPLGADENCVGHSNCFRPGNKKPRNVNSGWGARYLLAEGRKPVPPCQSC